MRPKRLLIEGGTYHVTSRTNAKFPAFAENVGRKIMLLKLSKAKERFGFKLHNFCVMPNHIHLLITPEKGTNLSIIINTIKTSASKSWNRSNNTCDHLWGERFFSRPVRNDEEFSAVYEYIDQNPIKAGLVEKAEDWEACGAYYMANDIEL